MRSNTHHKVFALSFSCNPEGSGSGNQGGGFLPSYQQPEGSGSGNQGGGFLPPAF